MIYLQRHTGVAAVLVLLLLGVAVAAQAEGADSPALTRCSTQQIVGSRRGILASDKGSVYVGSSDGLITAYASKGLAFRWRLELGGEFASSILVLDGAIAVVNNAVVKGVQAAEGSTIRVIASGAGVTSWSAKLPYSDKYYLGSLNGEIVALSAEGQLIMIDMESGGRLTEAGQFGKVTAPPAYFQDRIAFGTDKKFVIAYSVLDRSTVLKKSLDMLPRSVAFSRKGDLIVGDERGQVRYIESPDGHVSWTFKTGAAISSIREADDGRILLTSLDNFVYLISDYNGNVIWKRRLSGRIVDGGVTVGNYFVVLIAGENSGFALSLTTGKVSDVLTLNDNDLVSGFAVATGNNTFAFTTAAAIESYAVGECAQPENTETKEAA